MKLNILNRGNMLLKYGLNSRYKGRAIALLPIGVFLVIFLGSGIITGDFYAMPAIATILLFLVVVGKGSYSMDQELPYNILFRKRKWGDEYL